MVKETDLKGSSENLQEPQGLSQELQGLIALLQTIIEVKDTVITLQQRNHQLEVEILRLKQDFALRALDEQNNPPVSVYSGDPYASTMHRQMQREAEEENKAREAAEAAKAAEADPSEHKPSVAECYPGTTIPMKPTVKARFKRHEPTLTEPISTEE